MPEFAPALRDLTKPRVTAKAAPGQAVALTADAWVPKSAYHPGQELSYVEFTANVACGATTEGTANTIVTSDTLVYDGKPVLIEFYSPQVLKGTTNITIVLYEDGSSIGKLALAITTMPVKLARRLSPTAGQHIYSVRGYVDAGITGSVHGGAGGSGNEMPGFIRITRAAGGNE